MKLDDVEKIIKMFEKSTVNSIDLEIDNIKIKLEKGNTVVVQNAMPVQNQAKPEEVAEDTGTIIKSPLVGTFHQAPAPDEDPFVTVGAKVKKGEKLCIIEAMKVMNEINAPCDGVVLEINVAEGDMVEFDQKLFVIGDENV